MCDYAADRKSFLNDPLKYWEENLQVLKWFKPYHTVYQNTDPILPKWFCGGEVNICYDMLDRQVEEGYGDDVISIFDSYYTKETARITYKALLDDVSKLAGVYYDEVGIRPGDHVLIYMPMIPEALVSILAAIRVGAVNHVMGPDSEKEIAARIDHFQPKLIVMATAGYECNELVNIKEKMDTSVDLATHKPIRRVIYQRNNLVSAAENGDISIDTDIDFWQSIEKARPLECIPVEINSPLFMVYTSGTTGNPKGIIRSTISNIYSFIHGHPTLGKQSDNINTVAFLGSTYSLGAGYCGMICSSLFLRRPCILYEGPVRIPDINEVYRIISRYKVNVIFFTPATLRTIMQKDPDGIIAKLYQPFNVNKFVVSGCTGDMLTFDWTERIFGAKIIQFFGQTESGVLTEIVDDQPLMSSGKLRADVLVEILKEDGTPAAAGEIGRMALKFPLPYSLMSGYYNDEERYRKEFLKFPGYYDLNDDGRIDENGFLYVSGRAGDVFESNGRWISCYSLEEAIHAHPDVVNCAVVTKAARDKQLLYYIPITFISIRPGTSVSVDVIKKDVVSLVLKKMGNCLSFPEPTVLDHIPITASGKVARGIVQELVRNSDNTLIKF